MWVPGIETADLPMRCRSANQWAVTYINLCCYCFPHEGHLCNEYIITQYVSKLQRKINVRGAQFVVRVVITNVFWSPKLLEL